ncbi:cytochrome P450 4C1 isoform X1 [Plutella xylostella]|uniref:cytochrome P450 4C1 isoform X1 n=1 Tax=Plutella xylostella TaxID=51655 RepID=UPI0020327F07|nr:cytochrome P450 4C1 isoform X1 [Plutella xylostella]XP_048486404.1 cytochrome P450 4C1 isoform X1 [Plutella xylostella]
MSLLLCCILLASSWPSIHSSQGSHYEGSLNCGIKQDTKDLTCKPGANDFILTPNYFFELVTKYSAIVNQNGGIMKGLMGPMVYFHVTDPDIALKLMNACLKKNYLYNVAKQWLGDGLITGDVVTWKRHRKLIMPTFSQTTLNEFQDIFNTQSRSFSDSLRSLVGRDVDPWPLVRDNALETICQTVLGLPPDGCKLVDEEYAKATEEMLNIFNTRIQTPYMHSDWLYKWAKTKKIEDKAVNILKRFSSNLLQIKKQSTGVSKNEHAEPKGKAFLDHFLELHSQGLLTERELLDELNTMIVAGHDTVATELVFILILLGSFPEVQERVYEEIQSVFDCTDRDVTKYDLPRLVYLEAVIKEVMRLYPVASIIARDADKDVNIDNHTIPAGSSIILLVWGINRSKAWGEDAEQFKPERWLDPCTLPDNPAFATFSNGSRMCLGKMFAYNSMKTTLVHVLRRFKVTADYRKLKLKVDFLLKPSSGHHINLELR